MSVLYKKMYHPDYFIILLIILSYVITIFITFIIFKLKKITLKYSPSHDPPYLNPDHLEYYSFITNN
jgi:hypothetical protein